MTIIQLIVNPAAGSGRAKKIGLNLKSELDKYYDNIKVYYTQANEAISLITAKLVATQPDFLIAIGGDGTLHQVVNGVIKSDCSLLNKTQLAFMNAGCGGDFLRQFPPQPIDKFVQRLRMNKAIRCDIGKVTLQQSTRYFINIASCGFSGFVAKKSNESKAFKWLGGTINYLIHTLISLFEYKSQLVNLVIDDSDARDYRLLLATICNGQYFAGGMKISPQSDYQDSKFNLVLFKNLNRLTALTKLPLVYLGSHLKSRYVEQHWVETVSLKSSSGKQILVEADGECIGQLPAKISILKQKLPVII